MATKNLDCDTFLTRLRATGLLAGAELARAEELASSAAGPKALALSLVERGLLTRFQAEMVLRGRTSGFILGQYRVLEQIGRGGMGRVFKAEHRTMSRVVALKVLSPAMMKTERARAMFEREVRAAARLNHPNIVTAYDANQAGGRHYLVMEYVDGPNLHELVKEHGPLPVGQVCDFIRQAALGLQYAHEMGMVHRDIKPANLLVQTTAGGSCVVKILDFGLARLHEPAAVASEGHDSIPAVEQQVMGTPDFLSPEQARNLHGVDIRADLYSLGCTMYFLLTGRVPFAGGTTVEKLLRHSNEEAPPVHQLRGDLPLQVSAIVARLMAKRPEERFQSPLELAQQLAPFADASTASLPAISAPDIGPAPGSGDSPWAEIFDDAPTSTVPSDLTITPFHTRSGGGRAPRLVMPPMRAPGRGWVRVLIIILAALLGFLFGGALIFLLSR